MVEFAVTPWSLGQVDPVTNQAIGVSARSIADQAKKAEDLGFHSFWLPENHFGDQRSIPSPLTLLAAAAAVTTRIKLATTSYLITIRNPLQAAEEVAVFDQMSEGRLILGLGRGMQPAMFKAFNLPTKDKRKRFRENLDVMLKAWAGESITDDEDIRLSPLPMQRPHPELWMAAFGPLALKQAGTLGMPYLASPMETLETLKQNYQHFNQVVSESGAEPVPIVPVMRSIFVSDDRSLNKNLAKALDETSPYRTRDQEAEPPKVEDWTIIGDRAYVTDKLQEYVEQLGVTHFIARGRFPIVSNEQQIKSHEQLMALNL